MTDAPASTTPRFGSTTPTPRRGRLFRRLAAVAVILLIVAGVAAWWVLTSSSFLVRQAQPALERALGGAVTLDHVTLSAGGELHITGMTLRARTLSGPAGEIARVDRAVVLLDSTALWSGRIVPRSISIHGLTLRISEDAHEAGDFNILHLQPVPEGGSDSPLPRVEIAAARVEVGEHDGAVFTPRGVIDLAGELHPGAADSDWFNFTLAELDAHPHGRGEGLRVEGRFHLQTLEHEGRLTGVAFDERLYGLLPRMGRDWWDRLELKGRVADVLMVASQTEPIRAELSIMDVALTIPIETDGIWARYADGRVSPSSGRPRMHVDRGRLRLSGDTLELDNLVGRLSSTSDDPRLSGLPYKVDGRIDALPAFAWQDREAWMHAVAESAPLDVTFHLENFRYESRPDASDVVELPLAVARILERLTITSAVLDTDIRLTREPPVISSGDERIEPRRLESTGSILIRQADGAFERFPYPMRDAQGRVSFTNDQLTIESIAGRGVASGTISVAGEIAPLVREASVNLRIEATNIAIDEALLTSFEEGTRGTLESLFHHPSVFRLRDEELLPDQPAVTAALDARPRLRAAIESTNDPERKRELERQLALADRTVRLDGFAPGGLVDLRLEIYRPYGAAQRTITTGEIDLHRADVVYAGFPYPIRVSSGRVLLEEQAVRIVDLHALTAGGGQAHVTGVIELPRHDGRTRTEPDLRITVLDDRLNPLLLAAIPLTERERRELKRDDDWPGRARSSAVELLDAIGIEGRLSYAGSIQSDDAAGIGYDFTAHLAEGIAGEHGGGTPGTRRIPWPRGLILHEVEGMIRVTPGNVLLGSLSGSHGSGRIQATGELLARGEDESLVFNATFTDFEIERSLLTLLNDDDRAPWETWWERLTPTGRFDAQLRYSTDPRAPIAPVLLVQPRGLTVRIDGVPLTLTTRSGVVRVIAEGFFFDDCLLALHSEDDEQGMLELTGSIHADGNVQMLALWREGRFEAAWVPSLITQSAGDDAAEWYRMMKPQGRFDAEISYDTLDPQRVQPLGMELLPRTLSVQREERRPAATFSPGSRLVIEPGGLWLDRVRARFDDGLVLSMNGTAGRLGADVVVEVLVSIEAPGWTDSLQALLPRGITDGLTSVEFQAAERLAMKDARLWARHRPGLSAPEASLYGEVDLAGGSLRAGVLFEEITGRVMVAAEQRDGSEPRIELRFDRVRTSVMQRALHEVEALVMVSESGDAWLVPEFNGSLYGGSISANAIVGVGARSVYSVEVDAVGVAMDSFSAPEKATFDTGEGRGRLYGSLRITGDRHDPLLRGGRGGVRVIDGRMASSPVTLRIVQLSQLMLPLHGSLDFADVEFFVRGETIVVERVVLESPTLILTGEGTMGFDAADLNLRLRPRGKLGAISEVLGRINDQLYMIQITGSLANPQASLVPVPGVGGLIDSGAGPPR